MQTHLAQFCYEKMDYNERDYVMYNLNWIVHVTYLEHYKTNNMVQYINHSKNFFKLAWMRV